MSTPSPKPNPPPAAEKGAWERIREQVGDALDRLLGPRAPAPQPVPVRVRR